MEVSRDNCAWNPMYCERDRLLPLVKRCDVKKLRKLDMTRVSWEGRGTWIRLESC